ncbi:MFS transporter [Actinomadura sp. DC4]|uniref:MFS transporter n=1 Tax=Actinomadura sp. DC4 TaxID=3055069 RepID=UPI0025AF692C|nr:MFS transporter [Actinomadura sp. DC4]MDN3359439.1 MFS transporter [Actinomadura sp. DC4]
MTDLDVRTAKRPTLLTRQMIFLLVASIGSTGSFYLLISVVPLYAATSGAGGMGAGLSTGVMMLATVLMELAAPTLLSRFGYRAGFGLGLLLLGVPSALLAASPALPLVLAVCLARGAGLGIVVVAGPAMIAELVPDERRGEALGLYGLAVGVPAIVGLPLGLWLSVHLGYGPVFAAGAAASLAALATLVGLPAARGRIDKHAGVLAGLRDGALARPATIFSAITLAAGILLTFLPIAVPATSRGTAALALLVQAATMPLARWLAGRYGDRHGTARLLLPSVFTAALGTTGLIWLHNPYALVTGAALFGIGFGAAQNVTLTLMFQRSPKTEFGRVSALWNLAYDGGMGIGATGFGLMAGLVGYPAGFALTAAVLFLALIPARLDRRRTP